MHNKIDTCTFQKRLPRNILGVKWNKGNWINNNVLYKITNQTEWSKIVAYIGDNVFLDILQV